MKNTAPAYDYKITFDTDVFGRASEDRSYCYF